MHFADATEKQRLDLQATVLGEEEKEKSKVAREVGRTERV